MCLPYTGICFWGVPAWSWGYLPDPGGCTCLVPGGCTCLVLGGCTCLVPGGVPDWSWGYLPGPREVPAWSRGCTCLVSGGCTCLVSGGCTCLVSGGCTCLVLGMCTYLVLGGVPTWSGGIPVWFRGTCLVLGGVPGPRGVPGQVLPPVDRMTHTYENITLAQTLFAGSNEEFGPQGACIPGAPWMRQ